MKILGIRRDRRPFEYTKGMYLFTSHFCLFFATMQYDDLFVTDPVITSNGSIKTALHIEDLIATFVTINCQN